MRRCLRTPPTGVTLCGRPSLPALRSEAGTAISSGSQRTLALRTRGWPAAAGSISAVASSGTTSNAQPLARPCAARRAAAPKLALPAAAGAPESAAPAEASTFSAERSRFGALGGRCRGAAGAVTRAPSAAAAGSASSRFATGLRLRHGTLCSSPAACACSVASRCSAQKARHSCAKRCTIEPTGLKAQAFSHTRATSRARSSMLA
mmetsp:Transcript_4915/g.12958  ORF Transcript_4915/g.12958 Transcript_4915/m.12958 type:complete len:206 (-) Transcript_4915:700-1317(-)